MAVELRVPTSGESISVVQVGAWHKAQGEHVDKDEVVVEIESDKATVEVYAPESGVISEILKNTGDEAEPGEVIGYLEAGDGKAKANGGAAAAAVAKPEGQSPAPSDSDRQAEAEAAPTPEAEKKPAAEAMPKPDKKHEPETTTEAAGETGDERAGDGARVMPSARRLMQQHGVQAADVEATGPGGRILKEDVQRSASGAQKIKPAEKRQQAAPTSTAPAYAGDEYGREEER
ncbi:MAG: biotin/lipoyl-containing protein, partial [Candidatus Hydrogenedentales bacterium]